MYCRTLLTVSYNIGTVLETTIYVGRWRATWNPLAGRGLDSTVLKSCILTFAFTFKVTFALVVHVYQ